MSAAMGFMEFAFVIAFIAVSFGLLASMVRLVIGPGVGDRILALDTMVINAIGLIVLLGIWQGTRIYFEVSLIIAMLGFVSTVATPASS